MLLCVEIQEYTISIIFFENDCRHRKYSLRSIFEAILYFLVSGCQWRMHPHDLPK
ncbi:transposase [uncultured Bacteroides sp.]|uniref:transposase n=1 Tax=uncultured Bacteroides sp. TaxID=162156 RepID=UPI0034A01A3F